MLPVALLKDVLKTGFALCVLAYEQSKRGIFISGPRRRGKENCGALIFRKVRYARVFSYAIQLQNFSLMEIH